jgi:hypothetical protein
LRAQPDDIDTQIGIYLGLEMPIAEIASRIGKSDVTVHRRRATAGEFIEKVRAWTASAAASTLEHKVRAIESKRDIKGRISAKAYQRLETLLEREEDDGLTLSALKEALDRSEGKALDRKAILSRHEETVTHEISDATLQRLTAFMNKPAHQGLIEAGQPQNEPIDTKQPS